MFVGGRSEHKGQQNTGVGFVEWAREAKPAVRGWAWAEQCMSHV